MVYINFSREVWIYAPNLFFKRFVMNPHIPVYSFVQKAHPVKSITKHENKAWVISTVSTVQNILLEVELKSCKGKKKKKKTFINEKQVRDMLRFYIETWTFSAWANTWVDT